MMIVAGVQMAAWSFSAPVVLGEPDPAVIGKALVVGRVCGGTSGILVPDAGETFVRALLQASVAVTMAFVLAALEACDLEAVLVAREQTDLAVSGDTGPVAEGIALAEHTAPVVQEEAVLAAQEDTAPVA